MPGTTLSMPEWTVGPALPDFWVEYSRNKSMWNPKTCGKSLEISGRWLIWIAARCFLAFEISKNTIDLHGESTFLL